jgi:hypothetical protein
MISRKLISFCLAIIYSCTISYCQSSFSANRPGQVVNPDITPKGNFMIESGFQYGKSQGSRSFLLPAGSVRYGLNKNSEISLNASNIYQVDSSLFGLTSYYAGGKIAICEQQDLLPKISFITSFILPFAGIKSLRPENSGGMIELSLSHTLGSKCSLYGNLGATWTGNESYPVYNYVISIYYTPVRKLYLFGEFYGLTPEHGENSILYDFGLSYMVADNIQIDLTAGADFNDPANNHFIQIGAAFQIVKNNH